MSKIIIISFVVVGILFILCTVIGCILERKVTFLEILEIIGEIIATIGCLIYLNSM